MATTPSVTVQSWLTLVLDTYAKQKAEGGIVEGKKFHAINGANGHN
jgi:hypothetical protein